VRVAYTLEQCWHRVPGGTAVAAVEVARELAGRSDVDLVGVAARHGALPDGDARPPIDVVLMRPRTSRTLYTRWLWTGRPVVERVTGPVDVVHATTIVPPPSRRPLVVTVHDLAFLHEPAHFTRWGSALFRRSLALVRRRAAVVLCSSTVTLDDCAAAGIGADRLRLVPLGVRPRPPACTGAVEETRRRYGLPERFVLFVGTLEPRKNLARLVAAVGDVARRHGPLPLAIVGPSGWGDAAVDPGGADVRWLGAVSSADRDHLYAGAAVCCYPSIREGFGLPVLEAMAAGAPVVTSRGIATEEAAGGAAVLVDPGDPTDIARGIVEAIERRPELVALGRARAEQCPWSRTADLTVAAYRDAVA
jgi:glycosyltransferase involved in cell wall biosynthesis